MATHPASEQFSPRIVDDPDAEAVLASDRKAMELRSDGKSFVAIARSLGFTGARQAHEAFGRELRRRPAAERATLRDAEASRLDSLAQKTRGRDDLSPRDVSRRLRTIERLRQTLMMD